MHLSCEYHSTIKWTLSSHVVYVIRIPSTSIEIGSASLLRKPGVDVAFVLWMGNSERSVSVNGTSVFRAHHILVPESVRHTTSTITIIPITTSILLACMWCCEKICDNYVQQLWLDLSCNSSSCWLGFGNGNKSPFKNWKESTWKQSKLRIENWLV